MCEDAYGDDLVAIDWWREDGGECYCQNDCQCMEDVGEDDSYLITRDGTALPQECEGDEDEDGDEDEGCTPGWHSVKCLDDGTVMRGEGCASCGDCAMYDYTAATGGRATCELHGPDGSYSYSYSYSYQGDMATYYFYSYSHSYGQGVTATYYFDGAEWDVEECGYEDCLFVENIACGETRYESTANAAHWLSGNDAPDHFYLITPSETAYYHFSTCGSDYDTMLYLYDVVDHETPAPSASAVCEDGPGTFDYNGRTLRCIELPDGEVVDVLEVESGEETCRHDDDNSCPAGFDVWVPRSYEHAEAVVNAVDVELTYLLGVYREENG